MLLQTENLEMYEANSITLLKNELLQEFNNSSLTDLTNITESSVEDSLKEWYNQASEIYSNDLYDEHTTRIRRLGLFGKRRLWKKIRKYCCEFLKEGSTEEDIINVILEAVASIIPGGIIIKALLKRLVQFILHKGYASLCP